MKRKRPVIVIPATEAYCGFYLVQHAQKHNGKLPADLVVRNITLNPKATK